MSKEVSDVAQTTRTWFRLHLFRRKEELRTVHLETSTDMNTDFFSVHPQIGPHSMKRLTVT